MFRGNIVALVTPMDGAGKIDFSSLGTLLDRHVHAGATAVVVAGTTGECATLDYQEHCALVQEVVRQAKGRIQVIAGTGSNSTQEAIFLSTEAQKVGADACLLVTPYYNKPTQDGLFQHYKAIADAVSLPLMLYNVPSRTACDLLPDTVARLADACPNIVGIKEALADMARIQQLTTIKREFVVLSGDDGTALEAVRHGANGVISVTANVAPDLMDACIDAALRHDWTTAGDLDKRLQPLHRVLFVESNPIPVKWALARMGWIQAGIRLPLTPLAAAHHRNMEAVMRDIGVL